MTTITEHLNHSLRCVYTNVTSLNQSKISEIYSCFVLYKPDLLFINETWFTERSTPCKDNYVLNHQDRGCYHGGVALYSKHGLSVVSVYISISFDLNSSDCEKIWRCVKIGTESILVGCINLSPAPTSNQQDSKALKQIIKSI